MKKIYLFLISLVIISCNQTSKKTADADSRPKDQLALINAINLEASAYDSQPNDISKTEVLDSGQVKISNLILNKLNAKAKNWHATVYEIKVKELATKYIEVFFMIPLKNDPEEKYPQFESIILKSIVEFDNVKVKKQLKDISPKDEVLISGKFNKNIVDKIQLDYYDIGLSENIFINPQFDFELEDIKLNK
jgi:hypothetical protein